MNSFLFLFSVTYRCSIKNWIHSPRSLQSM